MHLHRPLIPKLCAVKICINCIRALGIPGCNYKKHKRDIREPWIGSLHACRSPIKICTFLIHGVPLRAECTDSIRSILKKTFTITSTSDLLEKWPEWVDAILRYADIEHKRPTIRVTLDEYKSLPNSVSSLDGECVPFLPK